MKRQKPSVRQVDLPSNRARPREEFGVTGANAENVREAFLRSITVREQDPRQKDA